MCFQSTLLYLSIRGIWLVTLVQLLYLPFCVKAVTTHHQQGTTTISSNRWRGQIHTMQEYFPFSITNSVLHVHVITVYVQFWMNMIAQLIDFIHISICLKTIWPMVLFLDSFYILLHNSKQSEILLPLDNVAFHQ